LGKDKGNPNQNRRSSPEFAEIMIEPTFTEPAPAPPRKRRRGAISFWFLIGMIVMVGLAGFSVLALTGKPIKLPVWAVAEVETRLNNALSPMETDVSLSVGAIEFMVDRDWVPRLALEDLRVLKSNGSALMTLPEVRASFDPKALLRGSLRPESLRIIGGRFAIKRNADGWLDLDFGGNKSSPELRSVADVLDAADKVFSDAAFAQLTTIEAEALTLILTDARSGQQWQAGDGRLVLENRPDELAAQLSFSLAVDQTAPARVNLTTVSAKASSEARMSATVDGIAARDLAAQSAPLAWLAVLDAPISGRLAVAIDDHGQFGLMESTLEIAAGVLRPTPQTDPIAFDRAGLALAYDPAVGRIGISVLSVESPSLRLTASGQSYIMDTSGSPFKGTLVGAQPGSFLTQIAFSQVKVDPAGLFEAPVQFSQGSLDLRLTLKPFAIDIGQLTLTEKETNVALRGRVAADPNGWRVALDVALDEIEPGQLIAIWPVRLVAKTRDWLALNVLEGTLFDVKAAVRLAPETEPRLSLGYEFVGTDVRFLKALPPIQSASGYSSIEGQTYSLVLEKGHVTPPVGGDIDVKGTVFKIADISQKPTVADITLVSESSLTATLSLLDQPPFGFLTKAKRPVDLGQGRAKLLTKLSFPLKAKVLLEDVNYSVTGQVFDFQSDILVPGRRVTAPQLALTADTQGMQVAGKGLLETLPFDVTFAQGFGPKAKGRSDIAGSVTLSDAALRDLGVTLPKGMIKGSGPAQIKVDLVADQPAELALKSDLRGLGLSIPPLGWSKPPSQGGQLELAATLGKVPEVTSMRFDGAGLRATGKITLRDGGGLAAASFDRVELDGWLDAAVTLEGRGEGRAVGVNVTSGDVDLRQLAVKRSGVSGTDDGPLQVQLDRLRVSDGIALTDFQGEFSSRGGFNGTFTANVNDAAAVRGTVVPSPAGSAVRIRSENAGRVMAAAGVFANARGGDLDLQLVPTGAKGEYNGRAKIGTIRVQNASVLAELLSAISVVGVLEQLNGSGLVFTRADADFLLTPDAVEVTRGSAVGASLGVSMAGVYQSGSKQLSMQGVISPIYLLNGIGSFLTRKGEGLFGFNYKIRGTADAPKISVNPLSILTPGMFRELFRRPAPVLPRSSG
jgi:Protein of unknown function